MEAKRAKRLDRFGQFSVACAQQALDDAGIDLAREDRERVGAMMGTALGGIRIRGGAARACSCAGAARAWSPRSRSRVFGGAASCNIAIEFGAHGAQQHQRDELRLGHDRHRRRLPAIRDGYADVMLAGGAEAPLAPLCFGAFALIRAMSHAQRRSGAALAAVRQGPRRLRDGRGRGRARARGARARGRARRAHLRRSRRLRHRPTTRTT